MGANIALLRHVYDVSIDTRLHVNEQTICNLYKLHNDNEQYATVGVMRDLINCLDGLYDIHYFNYDDIGCHVLDINITPEVEEQLYF